MSEQHIKDRITESLKVLAAQAQAADEILDGLKQDNKGRFASIFPKHSTFNTTAIRFLPYLEEVDNELQNLPPMTESTFQPSLQSLMNKLGMLHEILNVFHEIKDDEKS